MGCGNRGRAILVGRTPRARALLREGKIKKLIREGVSAEVAEIAVRHQYGMEVAALAEDIFRQYKAGLPVLDGAPSRHDFDRHFAPGTGEGFTMPRCWAAMDIARLALQAVGL
jgi:hypothetical protein